LFENRTLNTGKIQKLSQAQSKQQFSPGIHRDFAFIFFPHFLSVLFFLLLVSLIDICRYCSLCAALAENFDFFGLHQSKKEMGKKWRSDIQTNPI